MTIGFKNFYPKPTLPLSRLLTLLSPWNAAAVTLFFKPSSHIICIHLSPLFFFSILTVLKLFISVNHLFALTCALVLCLAWTDCSNIFQPDRGSGLTWPCERNMLIKYQNYHQNHVHTHKQTQVNAYMSCVHAKVCVPGLTIFIHTYTNWQSYSANKKWKPSVNTNSNVKHNFPYFFNIFLQP